MAKKAFDDLSGKEIPEADRNFGRQATLVEVAPGLNVHIQFVRENRALDADVDQASFLTVLDTVKRSIKNPPAVPDSGTSEK